MTTNTNKLTKKQQRVFEATKFLASRLYSRYIFNEMAAEAQAAGDVAEASRNMQYGANEGGTYWGYIEALKLFMSESEVNAIVEKATEYATESVKTHVNYKNRETA